MKNLIITIAIIFSSFSAFAQLHSGSFSNTFDFNSSTVVGGGTNSFTNVDGTDLDINFAWDANPPGLSSQFDDGSYSGLAGGANFWITSGLGTDAYTMCIDFSGATLTEVGFDVVHINYPGFGGGDKVTINAETVGRNSIIPTYTQPSFVDYTLSGNVADAFAYDNAPEYNLGVNLTADAADPIAQVCITWEECSSCGTGGHGVGISDINFNTPCNDNPVTLTINFDDYPEETSWQIADDANSVVASGGTYGNQADGSTLTQNICLPEGCYTFTMFDAYSDGMCCSYGNGSYTLTDGTTGLTLASGASFGSSESTVFCVPAGGGLPIELTYFEAAAKEDIVNLEWETAMEENNEYFQIERSIDGKNWENVLKVAGQGDSNTDQYYNEIDENPFAGVSYYRLKQVDFDGAFTYSDVQVVEIEARSINTEINVFPIPANDFITLETNQDLDHADVRILNSMGIALNVNALNKSNNSIRFDISQLQTGVYFLSIAQNNEVTTKKFFVQ